MSCMSRPTHYKVVAASRGCTLELYVEHPEAGPLGTFGRGPYCVSWTTIQDSQVPDVVAQLAREGLRELEPDA